MPRGNPANSQMTKATLGLRELLLNGTFKPRERVPELRSVNNPPSEDRNVKTPLLDAEAAPRLVLSRSMRYCTFGSRSATT